MSKKTSLWYNYDLGDTRKFITVIKKLEFMVRKSFSYQIWQKRTKYPISSCPTCGDSFEFVRPETHHFSPGGHGTLFDVVEGILHKFIDLNKLDEMTDFEVADEIMQAHFEKKVNYIVLCEHCHARWHADHPDMLEVMDEAFINQKKIVDEFYNKDISPLPSPLPSSKKTDTGTE